MSLANLGDLRAAVSEWLYRVGDTALAARADDFIDLFESEFTSNPDMRALEMELKNTVTLTTAAVDLPAGYIEAIRFQTLGAPINAQNVPLDFVTVAEAAKLDATTEQTGTCQNYTLLDEQIVLTPQQFAPVGAQLEMIYLGFTQLKDAPGGVNWLLQKHKHVYLYGSLLQASAYIDDDAQIAKWQTGLDRAMANLSKTFIKRRVGAGPLKMRPSAGFIT